MRSFVCVHASPCACACAQQVAQPIVHCRLLRANPDRLLFFKITFFSEYKTLNTKPRDGHLAVLVLGAIVVLAHVLEQEAELAVRFRMLPVDSDRVAKLSHPRACVHACTTHAMLGEWQSVPGVLRRCSPFAPGILVVTTAITKHFDFSQR